MLRHFIEDNSYIHKHGRLVLPSVVIGVAGGLGAIAFRYILQASHWVFFDQLLPLVTVHIGGLNLGVILLPAIGGLIVGPVVYRYAKEAKGHGVPEVIDAVHRKGGRIGPAVAFVKILVSSVTIGSGGSAGREGPIAQIGAAVGSMLGRFAAKHPADRKVFVSCGVAAGISATFNAPLGGALFAIEVIADRTGLFTAVPILVAAVMGDVVVTAILGAQAVFPAPAYALQSPVELPVLLVLGIWFGVLSFVWSTTFYVIEARFDKLSFPERFKPVLGGLAVGVMGMFLFEHGTMGVGYEDIERALSGGLSVKVLLLLGGAKIIATSLSIGSGGSGGIFAPTLYIGAMLGAATGIVGHALLPGVITQPNAYALIGMGALFSGIGRAPVTALIMIPEMTGNYSLLIPMTIVSAASYVVARVLSPSSMYLMKLERRGTKIQFRENVLEGVVVEDAMTKQLVSVSPSMTAADMSRLLAQEHHPAFPVIGEDGSFAGMMTVYDLHRVPHSQFDTACVADLMHTQYPHVRPSSSAYDALQEMVRNNLGRIPVIDMHGGLRRIVGVISKTDVVETYGRLME